MAIQAIPITPPNRLAIPITQTRTINLRTIQLIPIIQTNQLAISKVTATSQKRLTLPAALPMAQNGAIIAPLPIAMAKLPARMTTLELSPTATHSLKTLLPLAPRAIRPELSTPVAQRVTATNGPTIAA